MDTLRERHLAALAALAETGAPVTLGFEDAAFGERPAGRVAAWDQDAGGAIAGVAVSGLQTPAQGEIPAVVSLGELSVIDFCVHAHD